VARGERGEHPLRFNASDFNFLLGKQDGYGQQPFNVHVGGAYEKGYREGQRLYNEQQQRCSKK
jgi:hypothetical protein